MANYKTANLKPETMQRLREYAVGDESVDSTVQRLLNRSDEQPARINDDHAKQIYERLDRIESAALTAEERTGTIEKKVDDLR